MKYALLALMVFHASCRVQSRGPIAQQFYEAGGGDPHSQTGDQIMSWFLNGRRQFATHIAKSCSDLLTIGKYDLYDQRNEDDLKVCLAAKWSQIEPIKSDGKAF